MHRPSHPRGADAYGRRRLQDTVGDGRLASAQNRKAGMSPSRPFIVRGHEWPGAQRSAGARCVPGTVRTPSGEDGSVIRTSSEEPSAHTTRIVLPGASVENGVPLRAR